MQPSAQFLPLPDFGSIFDEEKIRAVRNECERLAGALRQEAAAMEENLVPLVDAASLPEWQSLAQVSYETTRFTIGTMLGAAMFALHLVAGQYELILPLLDAQIRVGEII